MTAIPASVFWTDYHDELSHVRLQQAAASQPPPHTVYFDLEVRRGPDEYGGDWERVRREGGVSVLCIWDDREGRPFFYDDHTLAEAAERLSAADVVVSFNGTWFDVPLIENHLMRNLQLTEHVDLFALVKSGLDRVGKSFKGHGLDALASAALGRGKTGQSSHAPELARVGRWAELTNYCLEDVLLTRDLGHFIAREGYVIDKDGERLLLSVPAWFTAPGAASPAPRRGQAVEEKASRTDQGTGSPELQAPRSQISSQSEAQLS